MLGSTIIKFLCQSKYNVIAQYNKSQIKFSAPNLIKLNADIKAINVLKIKPDVVINCIGKKIFTSQFFFINSIFPMKLFLECNYAGVKKFIHFSSVGSLGAELNAGYVNELFTPKPKNFYEISKNIADEVLLSMQRLKLGTDLIILMPSNIIGYYKVKRDLSFLRRLINFGILFSINTRSSVINFVFDKHIAEYVLKIISQKKKVRGKKILNTAISIKFISEYFRSKRKKKIKIITFTKNFKSIIRLFLTFVNFFLRIQWLKNIIFKTQEIDSNRIFYSTDKFTNQTFNNSKTKLDFVKYLNISNKENDINI